MADDDYYEPEDEGEILMGCWDCQACGASRIRGDAYQCASCGSPRPQNFEFYLPTDAEVVTDPGGVQAAEAGADWQCGFCQSWMPATDTICRNCRSTLADSIRRAQTSTQYSGEAAVMSITNDKEAINIAAPTIRARKSPGCSPAIPLAIAGVVAVAVAPLEYLRSAPGAFQSSADIPGSGRQALLHKQNAHVPRSLLAEMPPQRRKLRKSFANRCIDIGISRNIRVRTIHGT